MRNNDEADLEKYIEFSGPHVWPSLSAIDVVDRYIFQRPEISYMRACDFVYGNDEIEDKRLVNVKIFSLRMNSGRTKRTTLAFFKHPVIAPEEEPIEKLKKIKSFLKNVRDELSFRLPNESIISLNIEICISPNEKHPNAKLYFRRRWL